MPNPPLHLIELAQLKMDAVLDALPVNVSH